MFAEYLDAAMRHAVYEQFDEDGSYYGEIPGFDGGFDGVWANESTLEDTTTELRSALEDWILVRIAKHLDIPEVDGHVLVYPKAGV